MNISSGQIKEKTHRSNLQHPQHIIRDFFRLKIVPFASDNLGINTWDTNIYSIAILQICNELALGKTFTCPPLPPNNVDAVLVM